jgi:hypothetical protein
MDHRAAGILSKTGGRIYFVAGMLAWFWCKGNSLCLEAQFLQGRKLQQELDFENR